MSELGWVQFGLSGAAGVLSTLSPCVLPLLPIILASATAEHPRAPWALAGGLALSYAVVGTAVAWAGASVGFDAGGVRVGGALLLVLLGAVLVSHRLQERFAQLTSRWSGVGHGLMARFTPRGLTGQALVGALLGVVWSPCVGPTLGSAIVLAGQGSHLGQVAGVMALFGLGAALPLLLLAQGSRAVVQRRRARLLQGGVWGKRLLGSLLLLSGVLILSGGDKALEVWALEHLPAGWTAWSTRF